MTSVLAVVKAAKKELDCIRSGVRRRQSLCNNIASVSPPATVGWCIAMHLEGICCDLTEPASRTLLGETYQNPTSLRFNSK